MKNTVGFILQLSIVSTFFSMCCSIQENAVLAVEEPLIPESEVKPWCGKRKTNPNALSFFSYEATYGDWPWHVSLYVFNPKRRTKSYSCGATIISNDLILTAAHCVVNKNGETYPARWVTVGLGKHHLYTEDEHSSELQIRTINVHSDFAPANLTHDIALLTPRRIIMFHDYVQPACLWVSDLDKEKLYGKRGTAVGWGVDENYSVTEVMKAASLAVVRDIDCLNSNRKFYSEYLNSDYQFCVGNGPLNATNVCNGDSGGGLYFEMTYPDGSSTWFVRGIVSLSQPLLVNGRTYCNPTQYVIFTDSAKYLDWIREFTATPV